MHVRLEADDDAGDALDRFGIGDRQRYECLEALPWQFVVLEQPPPQRAAAHGGQHVDRAHAEVRADRGDARQVEVDARPNGGAGPMRALNDVRGVMPDCSAMTIER